MTAEIFAGRRAVRSYRQTIAASPDVVFPLLCPVREVEWLDGFAFGMIYSASGLIEPGCVFRTSVPGEADTIWVVSRHDPSAMVVQFTRVTPGSRTCVLEVVVEAAGAAGSHVTVTYACTSTSEAGNTFLDGWSEDAFIGAVVFWEKSMNHFLKTGQKLPA